jgi:hypothetical protein
MVKRAHNFERSFQKILSDREPRLSILSKQFTILMTARWTSQQDELLSQLVSEHGEDWDAIHQMMNDRSIEQIRKRWTKILNPDLIKGAFLPEEDEMILHFVEEHGEHNGADIETVVPKWTGKQCRERWMNHLNPSITHGNWTGAEDTLIFELYQRFGSHWSKIAPLVAGRTENSVKNRYSEAGMRRSFDGDSNVIARMHRHEKRQSGSRNSTELGIEIDKSDAQSQNTFDSIRESLDGSPNVISCRDLQPEKHSAPRTAIELGR